MPRDISVLVGKTLISIEGKVGDEELVFTTDQGVRYRMYHYPDCCESVLVEDIIGDLEDLIGSPIVMAEESTNSDSNPEGVVKEDQESFTWTFYSFATVKGHVTIRWYGESNGYYSESVDFEELPL